MNKLDIRYVLSILASLGVIPGIAFLAIEIRDSNRQARSDDLIAFAGSVRALHGTG